MVPILWLSNEKKTSAIRSECLQYWLSLNLCLLSCIYFELFNRVEINKLRRSNLVWIFFLNIFILILPIQKYICVSSICGMICSQLDKIARIAICDCDCSIAALVIVEK